MAYDLDQIVDYDSDIDAQIELEFEESWRQLHKDDDPGPCSTRPPSQDQPSTEGLRAWLDERGLGVGQVNHYLTIKTPITLRSEIEIDLTPSYPLFTPFNLATLGLEPPGAPPLSPLKTPVLSPPLPDYDWNSFGASSCETAETEAACCSCEPSNNPSMENAIDSLSDLPYGSPNLSLGGVPPDLPVDYLFPPLDFFFFSQKFLT